MLTQSGPGNASLATVESQEPSLFIGRAILHIVGAIVMTRLEVKVEIEVIAGVMFEGELVEGA